MKERCFSFLTCTLNLLLCSLIVYLMTHNFIHLLNIVIQLDSSYRKCKPPNTKPLSIFSQYYILTPSRTMLSNTTINRKFLEINATRKPMLQCLSIAEFKFWLTNDRENYLDSLKLYKENQSVFHDRNCNNAIYW